MPGTDAGKLRLPGRFLVVVVVAEGWIILRGIEAGVRCLADEIDIVVGAGEVPQEVFDIPGHQRDLRRQALGAVEFHREDVVQARQDLFGAAAQREQLVRRQVQPTPY